LKEKERKEKKERGREERRKEGRERENLRLFFFNPDFNAAFIPFHCFAVDVLILNS
jgi:hypothetical protein